MKVALLCVVMLSAVSASAQCTHEPVGEPLLVHLLMESCTPIIIQNAFLNGLRSIPNVVVKTGVSTESVDVVVYGTGLETKVQGERVIGETWHYEAYRYWSCGTPAVLTEYFGGALRLASLSDAEASVREDVAKINVQWFEKLRQERQASHR